MDTLDSKKKTKCWAEAPLESFFTVSIKEEQNTTDAVFLLNPSH